DGCDFVGIDACLYEKLKSFEETLKWESFSHNVVKEIYEDYNKTISLMADEMKIKIATLTIKVQNLQDQFDESVSTIALPLSKSDLTIALNEKIMHLWGYFDDMIKDFPKGFINQHRENLTNFCKEKNQRITAENEKIYAINDFQLKNFKEKLKSENFSDNIANEIYADYKKTVCFIVNLTKVLNELIQQLWCDFDDMAKNFPK
ncbi:10416_t:CDS:2, partial [Gigaspora rosea]